MRHKAVAVDATFCFSHTAPLCHFAKCIVTMSLFPAKWSYSFYYPNRRATRVDTFTQLHGPWNGASRQARHCVPIWRSIPLRCVTGHATQSRHSREGGGTERLVAIVSIIARKKCGWPPKLPKIDILAQPHLCHSLCMSALPLSLSPLQRMSQRASKRSEHPRGKNEK